MKAYGFTEYGNSDTQDFLDLDTPSPMPGELLIEVKASGVNPVDWKIRSGHLREFQERDMPAVLGSEVSGVVRKVGQDVDGFTEGDEVFGTVAPNSGSFAEYTLTPATATSHKPAHVSFTDASTLGVAGATAYDGVTQLGLQKGQTLLINGISGGVGVAAAQIARDLGINVVGTASPDKQELIESLGAILVPYGDGVADRIRQIMPDGVDAIFDLAGGDGLRAVVELLTDRTKLITAADPGTAEELGGHQIERDRTSRVLDAVASLVADGKLDPHVEDIIALDDAPDALAAVEKGHAKGKVVIQVG
ncbi:NADP-dependent oxidoreductase [Antrihabitans cavernicola]|uniref:NADP-dependent oxidoreductase n=1 Tax=Antrihabitans cavernicola TaxID=2495913 RepID=A0A5A7SGI4_9NOCA|nr:NADP-dependent oxidoreductase [Spelaeibacter cavernicola]KAA0024936.1 NADP-dependent oxidoreductase [Spelaeibacter cavernicola]